MALSGQTEFKQLETPKEKELYNHSAMEDGEVDNDETCITDGLDGAARNDTKDSNDSNDTIDTNDTNDTNDSAATENDPQPKPMEVEPNDDHRSRSPGIANDKESREYKRTLRSQTKVVSSMEKENENLNPDRLMKKLGLGSVQHIALQSHTVQEATLKMNGNVVKGSDGLVLHGEGGGCINKVLEDVKDVGSDGRSEGNSRSSTPASYDEMDVYDIGPQSKKVKDQKAIVENFKAELRTEEAKLIFLRKLLESQLNKKNGHSTKPSLKEGNKVLMPSFQMKQNKTQSYGGATTASQSGHVQIAPKIVLPPRTIPSGTTAPKVTLPIVSLPGKPPITQSSTYTSDSLASRNKYGITHSGGNSQNIAPATTSGVQQKYYIQVGNQLLPASGPPPTNRSVYTIQSYNSSTTAVTTTGANMSPSAGPVVPKAPSVSTQESKQTAAKAALRRQLEQTLLQIPPPKPPPADWSAIPNVNSMDFMMLVGLDEIVDDLLAAEGKPTMVQALAEMMPTNPRVCSQCNVDFSPSWRVKAGTSPESFLCEKCSTMNVKKELKAEHTSRLKAAFLKALKQEQEIEEKIKAGEEVHIGVPALSSVPEKQETVPPGTAIHHPQHVHSVHQPYKHHSSSQGVDHHHQVIHHRHHQVVQHYPRHTPLVHQLHQQHLQQQQMEIESTMRRGGSSSGSSSGSSRWHPYIPSHHHSSHVHSSSRHGQRAYIPSGEGRHEYYVVHHPQHSNIRWNR